MIRSRGGSSEKRNDVEAGEWRDCARGAVTKPVQLPAMYGILRAANCLPDCESGRAESRDEQDQRRSVKELHQSRLSDTAGDPAASRSVVSGADTDGESVSCSDKHVTTTPAAGEARTEVQEQRWYEEQCPDIDPVHEPIQHVQPTGRAERENSKRRERERIESMRGGVPRTAQPNEQSQRRAAPAEHKQEYGQGIAAGAFADDDRETLATPVTLDHVLGARPSSEFGEDARGVQGFIDRPPTDRTQNVTRPHSHQCGRALGLDSRGRNPGLGIDPHDPVLRHPEASTIHPVGNREGAERQHKTDAKQCPLRQIKGLNHAGSPKPTRMNQGSFAYVLLYVKRAGFTNGNSQPFQSGLG